MIAADSTTLVAISLIGHADLMKRLFGKIVITISVQEEVGRILKALDPQCDPPGPDAVSVVAMDVPGAAMSTSESETLALCRQAKAKLLLSDDPVMRREAAQTGIKSIGTLGILYAAHAKGKIDSLQAPLDRLREIGYAVSPTCEKLLLARQQT